MISVIIPTYNEASCIERTLLQLQALKCKAGQELIVVDGKSRDDTVSLAAKYARVLHSDKGKAIQLNAGAKAAKGMVLFFAHADMSFPEPTLEVICKAILDEGFDGGGFANIFDKENDRIKKLGRIMNLRFRNKEQSDRNIFYGDNGIFVRKEVFEQLGGFKEIPIMEDYDFSMRLKSAYKVKLIKEPSLILSSRRHTKEGFVKTRIQWILIKKLYLLGVSPFKLANWYQDIR